ncbi:hypothetical protein BCT11_04585 [Vibrio sp. 10N.222.52.B12]|uniref:hypothetical protein n=1 Tax=Vibrio sp. 10N.222.52.B12 TaxID=1880840 RepID=UPI000C823C8E|nr:hypothetical protein [Vibrio sp. 10N.222.52.B12]PMO47176.1 hypothetical protein BCT11_04585 [Vibrio sp. 10N.222.52.B12]
MKTTSDIRALVRDGANVKVPATKTTSDLRAIVRDAKEVGTQVTISGANKKTTSDLRAIARDYPGGVTFELDA